MSRYLSSGSLISSLLWIVLSLFSIPAGAVNTPGSYGGAAIAAGTWHTLALESDGTLWIWGDNSNGQLGNGTTTDRATVTPIQVAGLSGIVATAGGCSHTVVLTGDGTVWAWGYNGDGQLGDGTTNERHTPVRVNGLSDVVAIASGCFHTMALTADGSVWAWGRNFEGQLGDRTTINRFIPVRINGLDAIAALAPGYYHTTILKSDGTVWTWGSNESGQLGDGTTTNRTTPAQITRLNGITAIKTGHSHTVALKSDGTVWTWGRNIEGQLGDGSTADRYIPAQVAGLSVITTIAARQHHTEVLTGSGTVWTWGHNQFGGLGDGTTVNRATPAQVANLNGVATIFGGGFHIVALKNDGTVWTWGYNIKGQLGDGTTTDRHTPVQVLGPGGSGSLNLLPATPPSASSTHAINLTIIEVSPSRYRLYGTLVDANNQPACGLALVSGRCVFTCGPGSPRCEGGTNSLPLGQFDLTDLPTEADGTLNLQTFASGSMPGLQVVKSDGTAQLVNSGVSRASSGAINTSHSEASPGRYRLIGTLVDANKQPACGLALASGRCVFTCGPGSPRCEGGTDSLPLGQFDLTDLPTEANGTLNLQTFVFGSLPGLQVVNSGGGGGQCSYDITPKSKQFSAQDGSGEVAVSTQNGCTWTAKNNVSWIAIVSGNSGTGPGTVKYLVSSHSGADVRTGTLTIAGQEFTVFQNPPDNGGGGGGQ